MLRLLNRIWIAIPWTADVFSSVVRWAYPKWIWWRAILPAWKRHRIRSLSIATTNICNAKCVFCAYPHAKHPLGVMSEGDFNKATRLAVLDLDLDHIDLTPTVGDPLVDPHLEDRILSLKGIVRTSITTNCILMTKPRAEKLVAVGLSEVFISIPSFDRGDYAEIYGVDKWDKAVAGMMAILEARRGDMKIRIRFRNRLEPSQILRHPTFDRIKPYLSEHVTFNFTHSFDNWGGSIKSLPEGMALRMDGPTSNHPCLGMSHLSVLWDGTLRACGCRFKDSERDDMVIGPISDPERAVPAMQMMRRDFMRGKKPSACIGCSFYNPE